MPRSGVWWTLGLDVEEKVIKDGVDAVFHLLRRCVSSVFFRRLGRVRTVVVCMYIRLYAAPRPSPRGGTRTTWKDRQEGCGIPSALGRTVGGSVRHPPHRVLANGGRLVLRPTVMVLHVRMGER